MPISIDGLVTGIDTEAVVEGLLEIQQTQIERIELKRSEVLAKQGIFKNLEASLLSFRSSVGQLSRIQGSPFTQKTVSVSDETVVSASASSSAVPGIYRLTVDSVARAHQVATQGLSDSDAEITQGTLELRVGSGDLQTITIDSTNNTLQGLADAINDTDSGVSASIVKDASGGATPYRLLLSAVNTGTDNEISITNNLGASAGAATLPTFDFGNPVQAATNAQVTLGSGAGAISVQSSTNRIDDLIEGVNLDLLNSSNGDEITLTVSRDSETAVDAVESFVESFNSVMSFIDDQSTFNADSEEGGPLLGNRAAINIQQKLRTAALAVIPGIGSSANRLSSIGISVSDNGRLVLNKTQLQGIINGSDPSVKPSDLKRLFSLDGQSDNSGVRFVLGSSRTRATTDPIEVNISQAAERASIAAASTLAASTVIDDSNRTLEIDVDGASAVITLDKGTYTRQELSDHLEELLNGSSDLVGRSVSVGLNADSLTISSDSYGKSSALLVSGGTSLATLGITSGTADVGQDVVGSFIVNGVTEAATGRGQLLSGDIDNETTADLQVRVTLQASQIVAGSEANLTVTRGVGAQLDKLLGEFLEPSTGGLATIDERFENELTSLQDSLDRQQSVFDRQQERIISEFVALETAMSQLQSTSSFIGSQLASIQSLKAGSSK
jgi:flagellar hook-associated protein 2